MKKLLTIFTVFCFGFSAMAQKDIEEIKDGKSLIEAYISPLGNSLGAALNNGWYNTAKPHQLGGFDITITANLVPVPADAKTFNITESNDGTFTGKDATSVTATILGESGGSEVTTIAESLGGTASTFDMPDGLNIPLLPVPMLQAGVGLIKNTEIDVRFMPEIETKGVSTGLFGVGIKHDILQWLPIVDKIPIDVSFQVGYTKLSSEVTLKEPNLNTEASTSLDISATTINLLISKKIAMFTAYAGLGYNSTKTTFNVDEKYNIAGVDFDVNELTEIEFDNNMLRANLGFRFQIAVLAIQANYTFSEYPVATVGLGISVR